MEDMTRSPFRTVKREALAAVGFSMGINYWHRCAYIQFTAF